MKSPAFYGIRRLIHVFISDATGPYSEPQKSSPQTHTLCMTLFNIIPTLQGLQLHLTTGELTN